MSNNDNVTRPDDLHIYLSREDQLLLILNETGLPFRRMAKLLDWTHTTTRRRLRSLTRRLRLFEQARHTEFFIFDGLTAREAHQAVCWYLLADLSVSATAKKIKIRTDRAGQALRDAGVYPKGRGRVKR